MIAHMKSEANGSMFLKLFLPVAVAVLIPGCVPQGPRPYDAKADHEAISRILDAAVLSSSPVREFARALPEVRTFASVDSAWIDGATFFVKFRDGGGPVSWTAPPDPTPQDTH
jgi:hypothetical protein